MKQILQNLKTGETEIAEIPCPLADSGALLIRTSRSLVSAGTERMLVEFGKANIVGKARQQPDKVRMVLNKVKTDGLMPTVEAVRNKLDQSLPLGYCNVGRVIEIGPGVTGFAVGDRVASNGKHAEVVSVPTNLCAKIPDGVSDEAATFTVLGAIALQGIRLAQPTLGETFAVTGLGLIGLVTVQLLRAHGCRVLALDFDQARLAMGRRLGAETVDLSAGADPVAVASAYSRGNGVDGVIITATARSSEPVHQAALMCRKRGRIVLVGVTGLELSRSDFYEKELTFQVSCSYGPGRYDANYEHRGLDYPIGFVRWTEQRNFEAVLDMLADSRLDVESLISHRFSIGDAQRAYEIVNGAEPSLGVLLAYREESDIPDASLRAQTVPLGTPVVATANRRSSRADNVSIGVIGSGSYAAGVLIPAFKATGSRLASVASNAGVSSLHAGRKFGFSAATTDVGEMLTDETIDAVVIATRHNTHAPLVVRALQAGKHVFVEKPLALTPDETDAVDRAYQVAAEAANPPILMVGFNRRFAPHTTRMKMLLDGQGGPKSMIMTINAGAVSADHWTQDPDVGGGRIIGEVCHFIDLLRHLAGATIVRHDLQAMASKTSDTVSIMLDFADGSIGTIHYLANGSKAFPKERLEVFSGGRVLQLDNFRSLTGFGWQGFGKMKSWRQDKGQKACAAAFIKAVSAGAPAPIAYDELIEVNRVTLDLAGSPGALHQELTLGS